MKIKGSLLGDVDIVFVARFSCSTGYNLKKTIYVEEVSATSREAELRLGKAGKQLEAELSSGCCKQLPSSQAAQARK